MISGDTLIVWKLSRLACSLKEFSNKMIDLIEKGVYVKCTTRDISILMEEAMVTSAILTTLVNFDHSVHKENTNSGLIAPLAKAGKGREKLLGH